MYFKLVLYLNPLFITMRQEQPVCLVIDETDTTVEIRQVNDEERQRFPAGVLVCTASTQQEATLDIREMLARYSENLMPTGFKLTKEQEKEFTQIDSAGRIQPGYGVPRMLFPKPFQEFLAEVHHKLSESIKRTAKLIRWRMGTNSSHNPVHSSLGLAYSHDGEAWHGAPGDVHAEIEVRPCPRVSTKIQSELNAFLNGNEIEPLGHELFLEAWALRTSNPRSALVIGIAAAEVGFKQCIGTLVPDAEWLANNVPSPQLYTMLSEYLPQLPAKLKIEGGVLKPPKSIRTAIKKGGEARNSLAHRGAEPPDRYELKNILLSIRDLLYLLDYYCGFEWALEYLRDETREEMVEEFDLKSTKPYSVIELG